MKILSNFEKLVNNITFAFGNTYKAIFSASSITADRTYTFPNETGTIALTSTSTKLLYGVGAPDNGDGVDGNLYMDTVGFVLYLKDTGAWAWVGEAILSGGTAGQVLSKVDGTDYNVEWATPGAAANGIPTGGTAGQVLAKIDGTDFNSEWVAPGGGGVSESLAIAYSIAL
jgi:hypothetical protein